MYSIAGRRIRSAVRRSRSDISVFGLRISSRASSDASARSRLSGIERASTGVPVRQRGADRRQRARQLGGRRAQPAHQLGGVVEEAAAGAQARGALRERAGHAARSWRPAPRGRGPARRTCRRRCPSAAAAAGATGATCAVAAPSCAHEPAEARAAVRERGHHRESGGAAAARPRRSTRSATRRVPPARRPAPSVAPAQVLARRRREGVVDVLELQRRGGAGRGRACRRPRACRSAAPGRQLDELDPQRRARPHPRRGVVAPAARPSCRASSPRSPRPCPRRSRPGRSRCTKPTRKPPTRTSLPFTSFEPVGSSALRL